MIRLLLWAPNGAGLHYNGPGMSAFRLLSKLTPADPIQVTLAHGAPNQASYSVFSAQELIAPVNGSVFSQAAFILRGRHWLSRRPQGFDVFYGLQAFDFTVLPAEAAEASGIPAIVKVVQHKSDLADRSGWRALLGRAKDRRKRIARLSGIVAISDAIREELLAYGIPERKIARIPNGVDTDHFRPVTDEAARSECRRRLGWPEGPIVLFAGAITARKRPHLLVEALGKLKAAGRDAHLVLAGPVKDDQYGAQMRTLARDLSVADRVIWTGFVDDMAELYRAADIFALLSSNEGMPNAILEAMASGLPSVVTPIPGTTDLVRHGEEAITVEPSPSSVTEALAEYLRSPALRKQHGEAARARALSHFSARTILERHMKLYQRVMMGQDAAEP
jgi:glycosyltransferase involved in cell wall biosynthesis